MRFLLRPVCWLIGHGVNIGLRIYKTRLDIERGDDGEITVRSTVVHDYDAQQCSRCGQIYNKSTPAPLNGEDR